MIFIIYSNLLDSLYKQVISNILLSKGKLRKIVKVYQ